MLKKIIAIPIAFSIILLSLLSARSSFAASIETEGDLKVNGVVESTSGGFRFPDGTTLTDMGSVTANSSSAAFQVTQSGSGHGIDATSYSGDAIHASAQNTGIYGESVISNAILGYTESASKDNAGVFGSSHGTACGVYGQSTASGYGVRGASSTGDAIHGESTSSVGVYGNSQTSSGVLGFTFATSADTAGVLGSSHGGASAVYGQNTSTGFGVRGSSDTGDAIHGESGGTGVYGASTGSVGVLGYTGAGSGNAGVKGLSNSAAYGVHGQGTSTGAGVYGENSGTGYGVHGYASGSAEAAGQFVSSAANGVALVAESPSGTQVMKADAAGLHAGPGMTGTPLAYGVVNSDGTCTYKSSNVTSCMRGSAGIYYITIQGEDYDPARYVTLVTLAYNTSQLVSLVDSFDLSPKKLAVALKTPSGTSVSNRFYFVTFKP